MSSTKKVKTKYLVLGAIATVAMIGVLIVQPQWFWMILPVSIGSFVVGFNGI